MKKDSCKNCRDRDIQVKTDLGWCAHCLALYLLDTHMTKNKDYKKLREGLLNE